MRSATNGLTVELSETLNGEICKNKFCRKFVFKKSQKTFLTAQSCRWETLTAFFLFKSGNSGMDAVVQISSEAANKFSEAKPYTSSLLGIKWIVEEETLKICDADEDV